MPNWAWMLSHSPSVMFIKLWLLCKCAMKSNDVLIIKRDLKCFIQVTVNYPNWDSKCVKWLQCDMKCTSLSLETQVAKPSQWCFFLIDFRVYLPLLFLGPSGSLRCWKPAWKSLSSQSLWSRTISKIRWTLRTFPGWFPASGNDR